MALHMKEPNKQTNKQTNFWCRSRQECVLSVSSFRLWDLANTVEMYCQDLRRSRLYRVAARITPQSEKSTKACTNMETEVWKTHKNLNTLESY